MLERWGHRLQVASPPLAQSSMRHQRWHSHGLEHATRDATENTLLQARMTITAHHDQIETLVGRDR